uniref:Uncharacterized protein n=1 Tax=Anguilla anguilla TaxID=7936 RepID=A0A0E9S7E0_ANGAN
MSAWIIQVFIGVTQAHRLRICMCVCVCISVSLSLASSLSFHCKKIPQNSELFLSNKIKQY